jgi:hypothetical protein
MRKKLSQDEEFLTCRLAASCTLPRLMIWGEIYTENKEADLLTSLEEEVLLVFKVPPIKKQI